MTDELGSGMRNTNKYTKMYSGGTPIFVEDNIFRIIILARNYRRE
jgi:ATP-dependent DNA helicase RecG